MNLLEAIDTNAEPEFISGIPREIPIDDAHRLRRWSSDDAPFVASIFPNLLPDDVEDGVRNTQKYMMEGLSASFFLEADGVPVVAVNFHDRNGPEAAIGYGTLPARQREGYASLAMRTLTTWGFQQWGLETVYADVLPDNMASLNLLEKTPYVHAGPGASDPETKRPTERYRVTKGQWQAYLEAPENQ